MDKLNPRVIVGGDKVGGWIVEVHDGDNHATYSPEVDNADEAEVAARTMHAQRFYKQPEQPPEQQQEPEEQEAE